MNVIAERSKDYGDAWYRAGMSALYAQGLPIWRSPYIHNWMVVMSKLWRVAWSPNHKDSWIDIAGYATLVANHLDSGDLNNNHKDNLSE